MNGLAAVLLKTYPQDGSHVVTCRNNHNETRVASQSNPSHCAFILLSQSTITSMDNCQTYSKYINTQSSCFYASRITLFEKRIQSKF